MVLNQNFSGIGISGVGRIGRLLVRRMFELRRAGEVLPLKAINSTHPVETVAHLLKYDTVHGRSHLDITTKDGKLVIDGVEIEVVSERDPANIPWKALGVDLVIDSTGKFNSREGSGLHLQAGAKKVIISAPGKDMDITVVMGVNDKDYDPNRHHLISTASCTTNCVAPVLYILDKEIGVESGWVTTVHAYTNDQKHLDNPHKDLRRARACAQSIIPTSTGIGKALKDILPELAKSVQGTSLRVPTPDVSISDMTLTLKKQVTVDDLRHAFLKSELMGRYIDLSDEPLVSSDYIGCIYSSVIDGLSLDASGNQAKVLSWYDNEWGYACRVVDMARLVVSKPAVSEPCLT